jgi:hypothetical protein
MTLREACQILSDLHTRPHEEFGVVVDIHRPPRRGNEDAYILAWLTIHTFANEKEN